MQNGCAYCYANESEKSVARNASKYDPAFAAFVQSSRETGMRVSQRKVESWKDAQLSIFDL